MGKASNKKKTKEAAANLKEGTIEVSFVFDGITYTKKHQMTYSEMHHMKQLCREHGDLAADQMIWKVAIRGIGLVAENIMAKAALDYIKKNYKGPIVSELINSDETKGDNHVEMQVASGGEISTSTDSTSEEGNTSSEV